MQFVHVSQVLLRFQTTAAHSSIFKMQHNEMAVGVNGRCLFVIHDPISLFLTAPGAFDTVSALSAFTLAVYKFDALLRIDSIIFLAVTDRHCSSVSRPLLICLGVPPPQAFFAHRCEEEPSPDFTHFGCHGRRLPQDTQKSACRLTLWAGSLFAAYC